MLLSPLGINIKNSGRDKLKKKIVDGFMEGSYLDASALSDCVDDYRNSITLYDLSLLNDSSLELNFDEEDHINFIPNGRFVASINGVRFDCFFYNKKGLPLCVYLNGSKTNTYPEFKRWSWYKFINGSMLNIADPMYKDYPNLNLGWYWGNDSENGNYRELISSLVEKIAAVKQIMDGCGKTKIVFYSSSGGSAAAIQAAWYLKERCQVIAINPQIYLKDYRYSSAFENVTKIDLSQEDKYSRENVSKYIDGSFSLILVENISSPDDVVQLNRLISEKNISLKYGLNIFDNLTIWTYQGRGDNPHNSQEYYPMYYYIEKLLNVTNNPQMIHDYLLVSELWRDHWELVSKTSEIIKNDSTIRSASSHYSKKSFDVVIKPKDDIFNHVILYDKLFPETNYIISITSIKEAKGVDLITFGIKDESKGYLVSSAAVSSNFNNKISFFTSKKTDNLNLRVYPNEPGKANDVGLSICLIVEMIGKNV